MERLSQRDSQALYFVKAVAIFATVAAHASLIDSATPFIETVTRLWDMFSCLSVGNFFLVGGILYSRAPGDGPSYWTRKARRMILPWLVCGTLTTYVVKILFGHPTSLWDYINSMLGNGSWYYYITVYLFFLFAFKPIRNCKPVLWGCVAVNAAVLALRARYIDVFAWVPFSEYLNPVHWMGFFALGILLRKQGLQFSRGFLTGCAVVFAVSAVVVYRNWIYSYFHILNAVYSVSGFFLLLTIGRWLSGTKAMKPIREIGESTYCIYLLHMQIVQSVARKLPEGGFKAVFSPILGLAVMMLLITIGKWITSKLPFGDKLRMLVGLH